MINLFKFMIIYILMKNYYKILGVEKNASKDEIKQAFRKLAIENHPDKGGSTEKFQEIQEAYEILGNEEKKRVYDSGGTHNGNINMSNFDFFFNKFNTTNSGNGSGITKKKNHFYKCDITLRDVHFGLVKKIKVKREKFCKICYIKCNECNGIGQISRVMQMGPFIQHINQSCKKCNSVGKNYNNSNNCTDCENGKIKEDKIFEINIPKGVSQNKQYVFEDWGEQAILENEESGDLIITINILPDQIFKRNELNLIYDGSFTLKESIIGKNIEIDIFGEKLNINSKIFGILNPNKQYIIYGRGLKSEDKRGDLYITVKIEYPEKSLTDEEINILNKAFNEINL